VALAEPFQAGEFTTAFDQKPTLGHCSTADAATPAVTLRASPPLLTLQRELLVRPEPEIVTPALRLGVIDAKADDRCSPLKATLLHAAHAP
jgi:hypothetical protein